MKRTILIVGVLLGATAYAQNLNSTVQVTNSYKAGVGDVSRTTVPVTVPDSLSRFDYKFDYSVFDTPYKGAYEFRPYDVNLVPESAGTDERTFWLRAGAGYVLRPELQALWTPVRGEKVKLGLHQDFHGYYGNYRTVRNKIDSDPLLTTRGVFNTGYDLSEDFGADLKLNFKGPSLDLGAAYRGIFAADNYGASHFNALNLKLGFTNSPASATFFRAGLLAGFASDNYPFLKVVDRRPYTENRFLLDGTVSRAVSDIFGFGVDWSLFSAEYFGFDATPSVHVVSGVVDLKAGIRFAYAGAGLKLAPAVDLSLNLCERKLGVYVRTTGGYTCNSYASLKETDHWLMAGTVDGIRPTYTYLDVVAGVRGSLFRRLQYDLSAAYGMNEDMPLHTFTVVEKILYPFVAYGKYNEFSACARLAWRSESFDADGSVTYRHSDTGDETRFAGAPAVSGNIRLLYNYNKRIYGGVRLEGMSSRRLELQGIPMAIPGFCDLGLYGEFRATSSLAVWLQATNLLNHPIQRVPMHVEQGIGATMGIRLDLK